MLQTIARKVELGTIVGGPIFAAADKGRARVHRHGVGVLAKMNNNKPCRAFASPATKKQKAAFDIR